MTQPLQGLMTMIVTPRQAAAATHAAYGQCYRKGNLIYPDRASDWFHPVAAFKVPGGPAENDDQQPTTKEENDMAVKEAPKETAKSGVTADSEEQAKADKFFAYQKLLADKTRVRDGMKAIGKKLEELKAIRQGNRAANYEGMPISDAIEQVASQYSALAAKQYAIQQAETEMIHLCPDARLQQKRRQLLDQKKANTAALNAVRTRIDGQVKLAHNVIACIKAMHDPRQKDELNREKNRLKKVQANLSELRKEEAAIIQQRDQIEDDRRALYDEMRSFQLS